MKMSDGFSLYPMGVSYNKRSSCVWAPPDDISHLSPALQSVPHVLLLNTEDGEPAAGLQKTFPCANANNLWNNL